MDDHTLTDDGILSEDMELAIRDIQRIAARESTEAPGEPTTAAAAEQATSFAQREQDLLLGAVELVAREWIDQLQHVRRNSEEVEQLVLERAAKVKSDIAVLYALGNTAMEEARRGELVNAELTRELIKMSEERAS